jgi:hypothetical protein
LLWTLLLSADNGGSVVLGYEIKYLKDGDVWQTITVGSTETTYTISGLIGGKTNLFTIAPFNKYGVGIVSDELSVVAG